MISLSHTITSFWSYIMYICLKWAVIFNPGTQLSDLVYHSYTQNVWDADKCLGLILSDITWPLRRCCQFQIVSISAWAVSLICFNFLCSNLRQNSYIQVSWRVPGLHAHFVTLSFTLVLSYFIHALRDTYHIIYLWSHHHIFHQPLIWDQFETWWPSPRSTLT